jgi:hypothetical protein
VIDVFRISTNRDKIETMLVLKFKEFSLLTDTETNQWIIDREVGI